ncbi:hypothetical protein Adt_20516 [Abeliophyllum distichum]|uniref:Uncharacterized protein n=1 Tax=Abeliophyllum distichum TaxID=126358 RepID=A0ABD1SWS8_9LAMI
MGGRVMDERMTFSLRPPMPSVAPNLVATATLVVESVGNISSPRLTLSATPILATTVTSEAEVVGNVLFPFPTLSTTSILVTTVPFTIEVDDDSPSFPDAVVVGVTFYPPLLSWKLRIIHFLSF